MKALLLPLLLLFLSIASIDAAHDEDTRLFEHDFTLPQDNVARGVAYRGEAHPDRLKIAEGWKARAPGRHRGQHHVGAWCVCARVCVLSLAAR
jgi:hypothetical protein